MHKRFQLPAQYRGELLNRAIPPLCTAIFNPPEVHVDLARADLLRHKRCNTD